MGIARNSCDLNLATPYEVNSVRNIYYKGERMGEARPLDRVATDRHVSRRALTVATRATGSWKSAYDQNSGTFSTTPIRKSWLRPLQSRITTAAWESRQISYDRSLETSCDVKDTLNT